MITHSRLRSCIRQSLRILQQAQIYCLLNNMNRRLYLSSHNVWQILILHYRHVFITISVKSKINVTVTNDMLRWFGFLFVIREIAGSNLDPRRRLSPTQLFRGFRQFLQSNTDIVLNQATTASHSFQFIVHDQPLFSVTYHNNSQRS